MAVSSVKICVVGDAQTGKTSLITAAKGEFQGRAVPVLPPMRLPADFTSAMVPMVVLDTSSNSSPEHQAVVDLVLQTSDVIIVCFDVTRQSTLDSVRTTWYPRTQRTNPDAAVILACCKCDLMQPGEQENSRLRARVEAAVNDLPSVEVCMKTSAKDLHKADTTFEYALRAVIYPIMPIYDRFERRLRPLCVRALKRVFIMCDMDGDGALSDAELNFFQMVCYGAALNDDELQSVKQVVASGMPSGVNAAGCVTLEGFLFLHLLFIERSNLESIWAVLRKFGYNDQLRLRDDVLDAHVNFNLPPNQVYELSDQGEDFLRQQFSAFDLDGDGLLSWQQLDALFSTIPPPMWQGEQWSRLLVPGVYGAAHHLEAFLLKWRYSVLQCPRTALAQLLYLGAGGIDGSMTSQMLQQKTRRRADRKHRAELAARSSLMCYVFGARRSGKSTLVHALPGLRPTPGDLLPPALQPALSPPSTSTAAAAASQGSSQGVAGEPGCGEAAQVPVSGPFAAVAPVRSLNGQDRTLVLQEITEDLQQQLLTMAAMKRNLGGPLPILPPGQHDSQDLLDLDRADVAAFVFDASSTESFRATAELMLKVSTLAGDSLPCVLIAAQEDLVMGAQLEQEVAATVAELQVRGPVRCSVLLSELGGVFGTLAAAAVNPEGWVPETPDRKAYRRLVNQIATGVCMGGATLVGAAALYATYRMLRPSSSTSSTSTPSSSSTSSSPAPSSGTLSSSRGSSITNSLSGSSSGSRGGSSSSGGGGDSSSGSSGSILSSLADIASSALSKLQSLLSSALSSGGGTAQAGSVRAHSVAEGQRLSVHAHSVREGSRPAQQGSQACSTSKPSSSCSTGGKLEGEGKYAGFQAASQDVLTAGLATLTAMRVLRTALARSRTRWALTGRRNRFWSRLAARRTGGAQLTQPELSSQPGSTAATPQGSTSSSTSTRDCCTDVVASLGHCLPARALLGAACPLQGYVAASLILITVSAGRLQLLRSVRKELVQKRLLHEQRRAQWRQQRQQQLNESSEALAALLGSHHSSAPSLLDPHL